jgi:hypothetical protein
MTRAFRFLLLSSFLALAQSPATQAPPRIISINVPANIAANAAAAKAGIPGVLALQGIVAIPKGFDPNRTWPVLLITAPSGASAVRSAGAFTNVALQLDGWSPPWMVPK